jgi:hypothetical protein
MARTKAAIFFVDFTDFMAPMNAFGAGVVAPNQSRRLVGQFYKFADLSTLCGSYKHSCQYKAARSQSRIFDSNAYGSWRTRPYRTCDTECLEELVHFKIGQIARCTIASLASFVDNGTLQPVFARWKIRIQKQCSG